MPFKPSQNISRAFFDYLVDNHALGHDGFHGMDHWVRVMENARELATATGANLRVVELFALLHDSQRENEDYDPDHGRRAATYAQSLHGHWFELSARELELLIKACYYHADGLTKAEPTVQACWDADRLDLGRVGVRPDPRFLCTAYARCPQVILAAYRRSTKRSAAV
jgi:uncharacterized protein